MTSLKNKLVFNHIKNIPHSFDVNTFMDWDYLKYYKVSRLTCSRSTIALCGLVTSMHIINKEHSAKTIRLLRTLYTRLPRRHVARKGKKGSEVYTTNLSVLVKRHHKKKPIARMCLHQQIYQKWQ
jgi:hypothetical protein